MNITDFDIIKIKVSYIYWVKASVLTFLFHCGEILILLKLVHCFAASWWPLVLALPLCGLADCFKMVHLITSMAILAIHEVLPQQCAVSKYLQLFTIPFVFSLFFCCLLLPQFYLSLLSQFLYISDIIWSQFLCPLCPYPLGPHQYFFTAHFITIF